MGCRPFLLFFYDFQFLYIVLLFYVAFFFISIFLCYAAFNAFVSFFFFISLIAYTILYPPFGPLVWGGNPNLKGLGCFHRITRHCCLGYSAVVFLLFSTLIVKELCKTLFRNVYKEIIVIL